MIDLQHLPGGSPDEKILLVLRRHWFVLIPLCLSVATVLLLPPFAFFGIRYASPTFFLNPVLTPLFVLGLSIFVLFAILFLYQQYLDYYLDTWVVTDQRILNIEQHGLFARTVSELRLFRIQDVTAEIHGFLHTMFNYGDVHIQTAGETQRFEFEEIEDPNTVAKMVLDLAESQRKKQLTELSESTGRG
ncbi:MAG: PH domain-containing protein [bacterium]|nr:PH domain-containing protein [bacterium]